MEVEVVRCAPAVLLHGHRKPQQNVGILFQRKVDRGCLPVVPAGQRDRLATCKDSALRIQHGKDQLIPNLALGGNFQGITAGHQVDRLLCGCRCRAGARIPPVHTVAFHGIFSFAKIDAVTGNKEVTARWVLKTSQRVFQQVGRLHSQGEDDRRRGLARIITGVDRLGEAHRAADGVAARLVRVHGGLLAGVPGDRFRHGAVAVSHVDGGGQGKAVTGLDGQGGHRDAVHRDVFVVGTGINQLPDLGAGQGCAVGIKQGLVVHRRTAVPHPRVVGIILGGEAGRPAGAILLPLDLVCLHLLIVGAVRQAGGVPHRDPGGLPVVDAQAARLADGGDQVAQEAGLTLYAEGVSHAGVIVAHADGVVMAVGVRQREGIAGLGHHDILAVGGLHLLHLALKVFKAAVPVGVVGGGQDVVIHAVVVKDLAPLGQTALFRVGDVDNHPDLRVKGADGGSARVKQGADTGVIRLADKAAGGFVAHLHHVDVGAGSGDFLQRIRQEGLQRIGFLLQGEGFPSLGGLLLGGVAPEVGAVEVEQHLQAGGLAALGDLHGSFHIVVAAAVTVAFDIIGVVPDAHPHMGDAALGQELAEIGDVIDGVALKVLIGYTACKLSHSGRDVHAHDEVLRQAGDILHRDVRRHRVRGVGVGGDRRGGNCDGGGAGCKYCPITGQIVNLGDQIVSTLAGQGNAGGQGLVIVQDSVGVAVGVVVPVVRPGGDTDLLGSQVGDRLAVPGHRDLQGDRVARLNCGGLRGDGNAVL